MARHMRARRPGWLAMLAASALFAVGMGGGTAALQFAPSSEEAVVEIQSAPVTPSQAPSVLPSVVASKPTPTAPVRKLAPPEIQIEPAPPIRVEIPSAQINYPVAELPQESITDTATGVEINPPLNPSNVYWISAGGMPGKKIATYLTAHSSNDGSSWPLNGISNEALVKIGSPVQVTTKNGVLNYAVTELFSLPRADFAKTKYADLVKEDMVVITSCYTFDLYQQTRVLVAKRVA